MMTGAHEPEIGLKAKATAAQHACSIGVSRMSVDLMGVRPHHPISER